MTLVGYLKSKDKYELDDDEDDDDVGDELFSRVLFLFECVLRFNFKSREEKNKFNFFLLKLLFFKINSFHHSMIID